MPSHVLANLPLGGGVREGGEFHRVVGAVPSGDDGAVAEVPATVAAAADMVRSTLGAGLLIRAEGCAATEILL